jgi:hypothetical protein
LPILFYAFPRSSIIAEIFTRVRDTDDEILQQNRKLGMRDPSLASQRGGKKQLTAAVFTTASGI